MPFALVVPVRGRSVSMRGRTAGIAGRLLLSPSYAAAPGTLPVPGTPLSLPGITVEDAWGDESIADNAGTNRRQRTPVSTQPLTSLQSIDPPPDSLLRRHYALVVRQRPLEAPSPCVRSPADL